MSVEYDQYNPPYVPEDDQGDHISVTPGMAQIGLDLIAAIEHLARAMDRLASGPQPLHVPVGPPTTPMPASGPPVGAQPPVGDSIEVKMGKKVFAICKQQGWDIPSVGAQITGHVMHANSQKWTEADLKQVLAQFAQWGFG